MRNIFIFLIVCTTTMLSGCGAPGKVGNLYRIGADPEVTNIRSTMSTEQAINVISSNMIFRQGVKSLEENHRFFEYEFYTSAGGSQKITSSGVTFRMNGNNGSWWNQFFSFSEVKSIRIIGLPSENLHIIRLESDIKPWWMEAVVNKSDEKKVLAALEILCHMDVKGTIAIFNNQPDKTVRDHGRSGFITLQGDLNTWTESAIAHLGEKVAEERFKVQSDSEKIIRVSVIDVKLSAPGVQLIYTTPTVNVRVKVETGDGYSKEYEGEKGELGVPVPQLMEMAFAEAVENIIKDTHVVAYIGL